MKNYLLFFLLLFVSCQSNTSKKELYAKTDTIAKVEVFYFHQEKGCITC